MLDVAVAEIGLQGPRIVTFVGQRVAAGMPEHMRVRFEAKLCLGPCPLHHPGKSGRREWRAPLAYEHEWAGLGLSLQPVERPHFQPGQRVHAGGALLGPADV